MSQMGHTFRLLFQAFSSKVYLTKLHTSMYLNTVPFVYIPIEDEVVLVKSLHVDHLQAREEPARVFTGVVMPHSETQNHVIELVHNRLL